jgi:AcrR family transcriptional regulator
MEVFMPRLTAIRKQALDGMMKEALFEATIAVLGSHGVDELTMDRVASEAGIAKGSLYRYFQSKRELLEFVHARLIDPIFQHLEEVVAKQLPAIEKLAEHLRVLFEHIAQHAQVHELLFQDDTVHAILEPSKRRGLEIARQRLAKIFDQGVAEGVFRPGDPLMMATMYLGLCRGVLEGRPGLEEREQRERLHCLIFDTFLKGIATDKGQAG